MELQLPSDLESFVQQELRSGHYGSEPTPKDVVAEGLRALKRERESALAGIRAGLEDVEAGRVQPLAEAFAELRNEFNLPDRS
ncbi:MAG: hypothetical protein MI757_05225 [Pirellulales bacterium]|nr:hypothetical protein [Pirellulales bacterium]